MSPSLLLWLKLFDKLLDQLVSFGAEMKMLFFVMVGFVYFYYFCFFL